MNVGRKKRIGLPCKRIGHDQQIDGRYQDGEIQLDSHPDIQHNAVNGVVAVLVVNLVSGSAKDKLSYKIVRLIKNMKKELISLFMLTLVTGCVHRIPYAYSIGVKNISKAEITNPSVKYGKMDSVGFGWKVAPGIDSYYCDLHLPFPEKAIIEWRTKDNVLHRQEVAVKSGIPKDMQKVWHILFQIDEENVIVKVVPDLDPDFDPYKLPNLQEEKK